VSNVRVAEAHTGVVLAQSRSCVVERCHFDRPHVSGAVILDAIDVRVHHVTVWDSVGPAVILQGNLRNVDVVSCLLRGHRLALGVRSDSTPGQAWRTDRNVYVTTRHGAGGDTDRSGAAPQIVGVSAAQVNGTTAGTADALRAITEGDGRSVIDDRSVNLSQASRAATGGGIGMPPTGVGAIDN